MNLGCLDSGSRTNLYCADLGSNESLLRRLWLQTKLDCADSGSKIISSARLGLQTNLYCAGLWLQMNLFCTDSGSNESLLHSLGSNESRLLRLWLQTISTAQTWAPNESLLRRLWLQTILDSRRTLAPNESLLPDSELQDESLLRRLGLQTNLYCSNSDATRISTMLYCATLLQTNLYSAQTLIQKNLYCADSGSKRISTAQTLATNDVFTQDGISHTEMICLHFSIVEGSGDTSSIFFTVYGSRHC